MRKRLAALALCGACLGGVSALPARAQEAHCVPFVPDSIGCWLKCNVNYVANAVSSGYIGPNRCQMT
jgi:hypothetical protein